MCFDHVNMLIEMQILGTKEKFRRHFRNTRKKKHDRKNYNDRIGQKAIV